MTLNLVKLNNLTDNLAFATPRKKKGAPARSGRNVLAASVLPLLFWRFVRMVLVVQIVVSMIPMGAIRSEGRRYPSSRIKHELFAGLAVRAEKDMILCSDRAMT